MPVQAVVECEHPNPSLYTFTGNLLLGPPAWPTEVTCPLSQASVLLRGCTLRNTASILGVAIFTGHESKVRPRSTSPARSLAGGSAVLPAVQMQPHMLKVSCTW